MSATVARWVNTQSSALASRPVNISSIAVGESMIVVHNYASTTATIGTPDGWTVLYAHTTMGSRRTVAFTRKKTSSAEVEAIFTATVAVGGVYVLIGVLGSDRADWIVGPITTRATTGTTTTNVATGVTTLEADTLALVISCEATTAAESPNTILSVNNGFAELGYMPQGSVIETVWAGTKSIPTPAAVGNTTVAYRNTQASNGASIMVAFPPGDYVAIGAPIRIGDGSLARLSFMNASSVRTAPKSVRGVKPGFTSGGQFVLTPGATMGHRGDSETLPEMSEYAYDQAVLRGYGVLEFSAQRTLDGWWFGLHNPDLNDAAGVTGLPNVSAMTRAEVEAYSNKIHPTVLHPSRPFYGLEDFLEKYGKTHVLMVDPKNAISYNTEFMAICEGIVDPSRLIWKYYLGGLGSDTGSSAALAALTRGWSGTWGYAYDTNVDEGSFSEHAGKAAWTMLGMNIGAAQSYWDTALSVGKPVIGHIARTQADYNTARLKGAHMVQCANVLGIKAVSIF